MQEIHLVETSHPLRSVQEQALKPFVDDLGLKIQWHDNLDTITPTDKQYTMILAHEFFDALPFHLIEVRIPSLSKVYPRFLWSHRNLRMGGKRLRLIRFHPNPKPQRSSRPQVQLPPSTNRPKVTPLQLVRISAWSLLNLAHLLRSSAWLPPDSRTFRSGRA